MHYPSSTTMSSLEIAALTGKEHKHVLRDIREMIDALVTDGPNLDHVREDKDGRGYTTCYHLNRTLTETLLTGYSIPLRHKVIIRFHELEAGAARLATANDERVDLIANLLHAGLITKAQADARVAALLDSALGKANAAPAKQGNKVKAVQVLPATPLNKTCEPSGANTINLTGEHQIYLSELGRWVKGGQIALMDALVANGYFTSNHRVTSKGIGLLGYKSSARRGVMVFAERTLRAVGAW